jgi:Ca2+/H+ antiporter
MDSFIHSFHIYYAGHNTGTLETTSMVVAVLVTYAVLHRTESTWLHGCVLIGTYLTISFAFWQLP